MMYSKSLGAFLGYTFGFSCLTLMVFFGLHALHVDAGQLIDWITGLLTFWWLLVIVTVPWNVYFEAKSVLDEFAHSRSVGIAVDESRARYVANVARYALVVAIALHIVSASALFALSAYGISRVGYIGSVVALLLTALRPAVRTYRFICEQLALIKHRVHYPREDVVELRERTEKLESQLHEIETKLDPTSIGSLAYELNNSILDLRRKLDRLVGEQARLSDDNQREHQVLMREGQAAIAKISSDTQFLDHVREIVRLIKAA